MPLRYDPATRRMIPDYGDARLVRPSRLQPVPGEPMGSPNMPGDIRGGVVGPGVGSFTKPNVLGAPAVSDQGYVPLPAPYAPPMVEDQPMGPVGGPSYAPPMRGSGGGYGGPPIPPSPEFGGLSPVGGAAPWLASGQLPGGIQQPRGGGGGWNPEMEKAGSVRRNPYYRGPNPNRRLQDVFPRGLRSPMWGDDGRRY